MCCIIDVDTVFGPLACATDELIVGVFQTSISCVQMKSNDGQDSGFDSIKGVTTGNY